ncbi:MAG: AAA family ATPase [Bacteroidales bacterium]|jgi:dCMP deaminase|nr:AAA family ATPase [Bacteroidales bacterium]
MTVLGITGTLGSGKGTIVELLKAKGYRHFSVREFLIGEIKRRGLAVNRDSMTMVANDIRTKEGSEYIIASLLRDALQNPNVDCVIESIRNPKEIDFLKANAKFYLLSVDADVRIRYDRIRLRQSETDNVDFETFIANEQREMCSNQSTNQNIAICMQRADFKLYNNGSREDLSHSLDLVMQKIKKSSQRPDWDEYFMALANMVASRATCDRGRSGCVIVKDRQVLVTGYVGSPMGLPHCDEVGHLFKKTTHEDGTISNHCVRTVHAEQNAICQAARRGISIDGSTLYCRMTPCRTCAMLIINCGIRRVVCEKRYHIAEESEAMFGDAGIELQYFSDEVLKYSNQ